MYGKVILTLAFFAFVAVQLAASLKCYSCETPISCKSPSTVSCDESSANRTRDVLNTYYEDVKTLKKKDFECFMASSYNKNTTTWAVRGCIMKGAMSCSNKLKNNNHNTTKCNICHKDLCNSAGGVSYSILTIISLAVLAKVFVM